MDPVFEENLSLFLASLQSLGPFDPEHLPEDFDQCVAREQPKWKTYLKNQEKVLGEAVKVFKSYSGKKLDFLWNSIAQGKPHLNEQTFKLLTQYAQQTFETGVMKDAYAMYSLIVALFPLHFQSYLFLGKSIEQLAGYVEASLFYKTVTMLFKVPEILFLAANCELQLSHKEEAHAYLEEAYALLQNKDGRSEYESELLTHVEQTLAAFKEFND